MSTMTHRFRRMGLLLLGMSALLVACGGPPTQTLKEAETALNRAILAKKCAPDDYAAAERMKAKADQLTKEEKWDDAKAAAMAARKLADKAAVKAQQNHKDGKCLTGKATDLGIDPDDFVETNVGGQADLGDTTTLRTLYFDFNAFDLTSTAKDDMANNVRWLKAHPDARVTVAGHCDSRGSTEYNLALGEKRALVVYKYLGNFGVDQSRLSILSYGEEQPLAAGTNEQAYARNRRVEFSVR